MPVHDWIFAFFFIGAVVAAAKFYELGGRHEREQKAKSAQERIRSLQDSGYDPTPMYFKKAYRVISIGSPEYEDIVSSLPWVSEVLADLDKNNPPGKDS